MNMVNGYVVGYDLDGPKRNYEGLIDAIKSYRAYAKPVKSTWLIKTTDSASTIRDNLKSHIDSGDKLVVIQLHPDGGWATTFSDDHTDWMHNNLS